MVTLKFVAIFLVFVLGFSACDCTEENPCTDETRSINDPVGFLSLGVTGARVFGVDEIVLSVTSVEMHSTGNKSIEIPLDAPKKLSFLKYTSDNILPLFEHHELPRGDYDSIKLTFDPSQDNSYYIKSDGTNTKTPLLLDDHYIVSAKANLVGGFNSEFIIDIIPAKGLVQDSEGMRLNASALRFVDLGNDVDTKTTYFITASLTGVISDSVYIDTCGLRPGREGQAYVFPGNDITPDDMDTNPHSIEPVTSLQFNDDIATFFSFYHLPEGKYTFAISCNYDDPMVNEDLSFKLITNFMIAGGKHVSLTF